MKRTLLVGLLFILIFSGCKDKREIISSDEGISWISITDCNREIQKQNYVYGITLLSSGKFYEFFYDYESNKRMPVFYQCMDCGYPDRIQDALAYWELDGDTLKLSSFPIKLGDEGNVLIRDLMGDSLHVSYLGTRKGTECNVIMMKLKNSILDTVTSDNILSPRG